MVFWKRNKILQYPIFPCCVRCHSRTRKNRSSYLNGRTFWTASIMNRTSTADATMPMRILWINASKFYQSAAEILSIRIKNCWLKPKYLHTRNWLCLQKKISTIIWRSNWKFDRLRFQMIHFLSTTGLKFYWKKTKWKLMIFKVTLSQPIYFSFLSVSSFCLFQVLIFAFLPVGEKWINIGEDIIL